MTRNISVLQDFFSLLSWLKVAWQEAPTTTVVGTPKAGLLGGIASWLTGVPKRVYIVHGLRLEGASNKLYPVLWLAERLTTALATDVIVVSKSLGQQMVRRRLVNAGKTWVIGEGTCNGIDVESINRRAVATDPRELRRELLIPEDAVVFGFVGRLTRDKGIETLLEAFKTVSGLSRTHLLLVGPLDSGFKLPDIVHDHPRITWVGETDDVPGYLSIVDILVLPTFREGFGMVTLEAAALKIPTITTFATGAVDSVINGVTGLQFNAGDARALAAHMRKLADDPETRATMGRAAYARAVVDFRPERIWTGLLSLISSEPSDDVLPLAIKERRPEFRRDCLLGRRSRGPHRCSRHSAQLNRAFGESKDIICD